MIDLDELERQLEQATTEEVRALRAVGRSPDVRPAPAADQPVSPPVASAATATIPTPAPAPPMAVTPAPEVAWPRRAEPRPKPKPVRPRSEERKGATPKGSRRSPRRPAEAAHAGSVIVDLFEQGRVAEAEQAIAAHLAATRAGGSPTDRWNAAAWSTTLALMEGRTADARSSVDSALALGQEARSPAAKDRWWAQRFWVVLDSGREAEFHEILDHCRERAYRNDDPQWWSNLTLMLSYLGNADEIVAAFDQTMRKVVNGPGVSPTDRLDAAASLAEAAARMGDSWRAEQVRGMLSAEPAHRMVLCRQGFALRGAVARFQGLASAMAGHASEADAAFRTAVSVHRAIRAEPLLARTMHEWARSLAGRDKMRAAGLEGEASGIASRLGLRAM